MKISRTSRSLLATAAVASALVLTACGNTSSSSEEPTFRDVGATDEPTPPTDASGVVTTIPDDIPLGVGLWDARGDGGEYHPVPYHPAADEQGVPVDLCGQRVWPVAEGVDQLWSWATGPEYGDFRELVTLPSLDAAVATVEAFRDGLQDCQGEGPAVWTVGELDNGYDSVTFSRTYTQGLGHDSFQVTRVGNAVLLAVSSGEGSIADVETEAQERSKLTRTIAPHLCVFTAAGC